MWGYYNCYICGKTNINDYYCGDCQTIRKVIDLYGVEQVRNSIEQIFIRETKPVEKRTEFVSNKICTRSQDQPKQTQAKQTQTKSSKEEKKSSN